MSRRETSTRRGQPPTAGVSVPSDKRFRRSDVRLDARNRAQRALLRSARWFVPVLVFVAVATWGVHGLLGSSLLAVRHITVHGTARLSSGEVAASVDGLRGQNIFQIDFERYRKRIMDSPWVANVSLWRVLPSTIEVRVTERVPMAIARLGRQLYLVDNAGVIVDEYGPHYRDIDLPIVDGLVTTAPALESAVNADRVRLTSSLLTALAPRQDLVRRLSQVDVSNARDAVVMFDGAPIWLHLGSSRFLERLTTYLELVPTLDDHFRNVDYVDLRFDERVFVHASGRVDRMMAANP